MLGASSTLLGSLFAQYGTALQQLGGIVVILFGLHMSGVLPITVLFREKRIAKPPKTISSFTGSIGFGVVFGAGWTPCVGVVLGSILALAADSGTLWVGTSMLFLYSMGLGIPFIAISLFFAQSFNVSGD